MRCFFAELPNPTRHDAESLVMVGHDSARCATPLCELRAAVAPTTTRPRGAGRRKADVRASSFGPSSGGFVLTAVQGIVRSRLPWSALVRLVRLMPCGSAVRVAVVPSQWLLRSEHRTHVRPPVRPDPTDGREGPMRLPGTRRRKRLRHTTYFRQ